jgi:hypothetical protein
MKYWALLVATLYVLILAALTIPVVAAAFAPNFDWADVTWPTANDFSKLWPYWLWLLVMGLSQFALLAVPVRLAERRPVTRGPLLPTVLAAGLMAGGLATGAALAISEFIRRGDAADGWGGWGAILLGVLTWAAWSVVFVRMGRQTPPADVVTRLCRLLFKGSVLELLIAVPTHIVARYRNYCCAGFLTFIGLAMGISVMLFSFGPAVFFLFAERWKRLHPPASDEEMESAA